MPDFSYNAAGLGRVASRMQDEGGYGRAGAQRSSEFIEAVPASAGSPLFGEGAKAVRSTGGILTQLFEDLDRFWFNSSIEIQQTVKRYQSTDRRAAADSDAMYQKYMKNPVQEEDRP
ncbi:MAG: hypothetical protein ACTH2Q_13285 [Propionibacteriaceae bacterium]